MVQQISFDTRGDKIKFTYLKQPVLYQMGPYNKLPKFDIHNFVDYDIQFEKVFIDLTLILNTINEHRITYGTQGTLEDFFSE